MSALASRDTLWLPKCTMPNSTLLHIRAHRAPNSVCSALRSPLQRVEKPTAVCMLLNQRGIDTRAQLIPPPRLPPSATQAGGFEHAAGCQRKQTLSAKIAINLQKRIVAQLELCNTSVALRKRHPLHFLGFLAQASELAPLGTKDGCNRCHRNHGWSHHGCPVHALAD
eukprot:scaffold100494_cov66-Phaeocystis_antarctica.AAC.3